MIGGVVCFVVRKYVLFNEQTLIEMMHSDLLITYMIFRSM